MDIKNGANSLLKLLKKDKFRNVILFLGIGGIALIYISTWIDFSPKEPEAEQETVSYSAAEYERQLETGLRQVRRLFRRRQIWKLRKKKKKNSMRR